MQQLLKTHFGFDEFRALQLDIIQHVLEQKDALILMPTGGGKSLCYQLPALKFPGLTLVVSPLIALMKDQVDALVANGIPAAFLNSTLSFEAMEGVKQSALDDSLKLLYLAPERLAVAGFRDFLHSLNLSLIAIDEAHCISEWGHDFRPDYRNLKRLRDDFPETPLIALTATATPKVQEDIKKQLRLTGSTFKASFNRPNLTYRVAPKKTSFPKLMSLLKKHEGESAIIYCFSRKDTERLAADLQAQNLKALPYHAGLPADQRTQTQDRFNRDEISIIVATIAFGMGVDKPDIRLVVHMTFPKSLENYYQETGRAGRDGLPSDCVLFYSYADKFKQEFFIRKMEDEIEQASAEKKLGQMIEFCHLNTCRRTFVLNYFGERMGSAHCEGCDVCLPPEEDLEMTATYIRGPRKKHRSRKRSSSSRADASTLDYDTHLFEALRDLRNKIAEEKGVPPYVIFSNRSLYEMAYSLPQTKEAFLNINGVGDQKLKTLGDRFMDLIRDYKRAEG